MVAAIPFISLAFTAISTISALSSAHQQGAAASQAATYNATAADRNAQVSRDQAGADASQQQIQARLQLGRMRANYGASGITTEGSPLDVLAFSASSAELDRQNILYRGELKAMGYADTSTVDMMQASNARDAGDSKAGSALLLGAGKAASDYYKTPPGAGTIRDYSGIGYDSAGGPAYG